MKKRILGQFFTEKDNWLKKQIIEYIKDFQLKHKENRIIFDPFAGGGDLINIGLSLGFDKFKGLDIDNKLEWDINDSLKKIPNIKKSFIITNPPYLGKSSSKRRGIFKEVSKYFNNSKEDDLYKIAIEKIFETNISGIAIIPETFINSSFINKEEIRKKINCITILEDNPFIDTDIPVCVVCFNGVNKGEQIKIYKNSEYISTLEDLEKYKMIPSNNINMKFNDIKGKISLIAYDGTTKDKQIHFLRTSELKYDLTKIKISSRAISVINIIDNNNKSFSEKDYDQIIKNANKILIKYRSDTKDILLSPFKGNNKEGNRRRRLDFKSARYILEKSILKLNK